MNCSAPDTNGTGIWTSQVVLALGIPQVLLNFISLVCNSTVIVAILYERHFERPIFILFCSLAASDLLSSFAAMYITLLFMTNPESTIYGSDELLKAYAIFTIAVLSTIYNLMSIGIERYLSVAECTRMRAKVLKWQIVAAVSGNWGLAVLFGCLPLAGWNCLHKGHSSNLYSPFCTDYLAFITIPNCMVAFVCLLVTYFKIIFILKKQKTAIAAHDLAFKNTYKTAEMQVTRTSISIWILTAVSYVPFFAGVLWDSFNHSCREELHTGIYIFRNITAVMFTVNAIGNPIIYTMKVKKLGCSRTPLRCRDNDNAQLRAQVNI